MCGLEGQILDMLAHNVDPNGQLSPGLAPGACSADGNSTGNGWTQAVNVPIWDRTSHVPHEKAMWIFWRCLNANGLYGQALAEFLSFLDTKKVRSVTLWFDNALQLYQDSFTCPWFVPTLAEWALKP